MSNPPDNPPRLARPVVRVVISQGILDQMLRDGYYSKPGIRCVRGIPADARLTGMTQDTMRCAVCFFYEHESFAPVPYGDPIPEFDVVIGEG